MTLLTQQIARFLQSQRYWTIVEEDGVSVFYYDEDWSICIFGTVTDYDEEDEDDKDCVRLYLESEGDDTPLNRNDPQLLQKINHALQCDLVECNVKNTLYEFHYQIPLDFDESRILHRPQEGVAGGEFYFPITNTVAELKRSLRDMLEIVETWDDDLAVNEIEGNITIWTMPAAHQA